MLKVKSCVVQVKTFDKISVLSTKVIGSENVKIPGYNAEVSKDGFRSGGDCLVYQKQLTSWDLWVTIGRYSF